MCDPGLVIGLAAGAAQAAGQSSAARKNTKMIQQQTQLQYAAQEQERLVQADAANKEGYQAQLEQDRAVSSAVATGEGMSGATAVERAAEQQRQGALSIANAKDRATAANANYALGSKSTQIGAQNSINTLQPNPFTTFTTIATSGIQNYGAFQ